MLDCVVSLETMAMAGCGRLARADSSRMIGTSLLV